MSSNRRTPSVSVEERIRAKELKNGVVRRNQVAVRGDEDIDANGGRQRENGDSEAAGKDNQDRGDADEAVNKETATGEENDDEDSYHQQNLMLVAEVEYEESNPEPSHAAGISGVVIEEAVAVKPLRKRKESHDEPPEPKSSRRGVFVASFLVGLLVVVVAVVVTVVLVLQNRPSSPSPAPPTPAPSCSLCAGNQPSSYSSEELASELIESSSDGSRNVTCLDLDQIAMERKETEDECFQLQVLASLRCGCRSPHPKAQCWLCPSDSRLLHGRLVEPWLSNRTCLDIAMQAANVGRDDNETNTTALEQECETFSSITDFCCHSNDDSSL